MLAASLKVSWVAASRQRRALRISGCEKKGRSCHAPSKSVPGTAISAKVGTLSFTFFGSTWPRGEVFQPRLRPLPLLTKVETRVR